MLGLSLLAALLLDWLLGEPRRWHPLVGFGRVAAWLEQGLNTQNSRARGLFALLFLIIPTVTLAWFLTTLPVVGGFFGILMLYFSLGLKSLHDHARPVATALAEGDFERAQQHAAMLVSRDASALEPAPTTCESVLENGSDAVFGALFWFIVAGGAGAVLFRLANTLDAMWGYKTPRYLHFGWAAARLDDVLGFIPARLTALSYALLGQTRLALHCWRTQAPTWKSPNAGPVMASGAGALGIQLGGKARYHGEWQMRPALGSGRKAEGHDIERALRLVRHGVLVWLLLALALNIALEIQHHVS